MQYARAIFSSVACPALPYFSTLSHKRHDFRRKKLLKTKCVFWFTLHLLPGTFLIPRKIERNMTKIYIGLHVKYPLFLSDFNATWIFSTGFSKNTQISNFMKIRLVGNESFDADRQTGHTWRVYQSLFAFMLTRLKIIQKNISDNYTYVFLRYGPFKCLCICTVWCLLVLYMTLTGIQFSLLAYSLLWRAG